MTQLASHRELVLFKRVAEIIESARGRVARSVNSAMVQAYWLIGRESSRLSRGQEECRLSLFHAMPVLILKTSMDGNRWNFALLRFFLNFGAGT
jgi:hypothetical protein